MCYALNPVFMKPLQSTVPKSFVKDLSSASKGKVKNIDQKKMKCFLESIFKKVNLGPDESAAMTDSLLDSDRRGYYPHGIFALPKYLCAISKSMVDIKACPKVISETNCTAWVDGGNGLGPVVAKFGMNLAIEKAKSSGGAIVSVKNSNYFGAAGHYARMAIKNDCIGIVMSNAPPVMLPYGGKCSVLGSNPLAFSAKGDCGEEFNFDMASSTKSKEQVEWKSQTCEQLPPKTALSDDLKETLEPQVALASNKFLPFGELRGYGFALAIEILTGILSGANYGSKFNDVKEGAPLNIGQLFIAIDAKKFFCHFPKNLNEFIHNLRSVPPSDPKIPVRIPGDLGTYLACKADSEGIPYNDVQVAVLRTLSEMYEVKDLDQFLR